MSIPKPVKKTTSPEIIEFCSKKKVNNEATKLVTKPRPSPFKREKIPNSDSNRNRKMPKKDEDDGFMTLKEAKHDVFRYGIKGFSKQEQETANMQLAIKLGAKPPKNKVLNYKELMEQKKTEKLRREELIKENRQFEAKIALAHCNLSLKKPKKSLNSIRKAKISKGDVGKIKGHIGSFSNGVLKINKMDLKKFS